MAPYWLPATPPPVKLSTLLECRQAVQLAATPRLKHQTPPPLLPHPTTIIPVMPLGNTRLERRDQKNKPSDIRQKEKLQL